MSVYELDFDEAVLLQDSNVTSGNASVALILTNKSIIQINKGIFGGDKNSRKYPLMDLKELNGKPNVLIGKSRTGKPQLELYFQGYEIAYSFQSILGERKWASAIEKAYKSAASEAKTSEKSRMSFGEIFTPLMETFENARNTVSKKAKEPKTSVMKCPRCGAELSGSKGEQVKCSYCDTVVIFK